MMSAFRSESQDRLLICGTGALANLFAARVAMAGVKVTMLGTWREGLEALQDHGVRLVDSDGREWAFPVEASDNPNDCVGTHFALVLVKSWQTERAAQQLRRCLNSDGLVLTLQNGLGNREKLVAHLGTQRVALGVTTTGATLLGPGKVRPGGEGAISLGGHPRLDPLVVVLQGAGFKVEIIADMEALIWGKLVINAAINPLTALLRVPNGELLERPSARALMGEAAREVAAVAAVKGITIPYADPATAAEEVARRTAANHSSMYQDVMRGAPTEIDAICGAVVKAGAREHVPTPVNSVHWSLVKALAGR